MGQEFDDMTGDGARGRRAREGQVAVGRVRLDHGDDLVGTQAR
jgi:hypothetical protein